MSGSFQTLDSMFPKDPFFQVIQTSIFRAWLVRDTMHLQVLDFNKKMLVLKQPFLHYQIILICTQIFIT